MRRTPLVLAAALAPWLLLPGCALRHTPAWELPPPPVRDAPVVDGSQLTRAVLDNGLEVLVLEDHSLPRFRMGVVTRRGAGIVPAERAGLAAFTAELMERGAGERTALELAGAVDRLGASLSVGFDWDSMSVGVSGLSRDVDPLFDVLVDVVRHPRFEAAEAARARAEQLASLERAKDDPDTLARRALARALYDGHRYGLPALGDPEAVAALDEDDARAFHDAVFTPQGSILYATGDLTADEVLARVERGFGDWAGGPLPDPGPPPPAVAPASRRVVVVDRPDLGQAQITLGHEGIARSDPRRVPVLLLNTALGAAGFSSRLMSVVRADEGLTYGIGSGFDQRRHAGPFVVSTFTRVPETRRVVDLVRQELERIRESPPDAEELAKAQSLRTGSFGLALETSAAVASALVDLDVHGLPEDSLDTFRSRVRAVSPDDTARVARELIHPDRLVIVVVGPAEALVPQLEDLGPVEVVHP